MGNGLAAFAAGFGSGYLNQTRQNKLDAERKEDRDMVKQDFADKEEERNRVKRERSEMSEAGKVATVNQDAAVVDGLSTKPVLYEDANVAAGDLRQDRRLRSASSQGYGVNYAAPAADGQADAPTLPDRPEPPAPSMKSAISVNGKQYGNSVEADMAAKTFNDGRTQRIADTLYKQGRPDTAMGIQSASMKLTDEQDAYARRLKDEGVLDASKALRMGDGAAMTAAFNKGGQYKIQGDPVVTPEVRKIDGLGDVPTYNAKFNIVGPDGKTREMNINSHDLSMQTMNYEKQYDAQLRGTKEVREGKLGEAHIRYYDGATENGKIKANAAADKVLMTVDKFEPSDQAAIKSITNEKDRTHTAMMKGVADQSLTETSPAYNILKKQYDSLTLQEQGIYKKYAPSTPVAQDPLNLRAPAGSTASSSAPAGKSRTGNPMFDAIVQTESNGNPNAVSPKGAKGLMQVMPGTSSDPGFGVTPARDNSEGERTRVGQDYFTKMQSRYNGNDALAAIAYNWGPGNTDTWLKGGGDFNKLPAETQSYVSKVLTRSGVNSQSSTPVTAAAPARGVGVPSAEPQATAALAAGGVTPSANKVAAIGAAIPQEAVLRAQAAAEKLAVEKSAQLAKDDSASKTKASQLSASKVAVAGLTPEIIRQLSPSQATEILNSHYVALSTDLRQALRRAM